MITAYEMSIFPPSASIAFQFLMFKLIIGLIVCAFIIKITFLRNTVTVRKYIIKQMLLIFILILVWLMLPNVSQLLNFYALPLAPYLTDKHETTKGFVKVLRVQPKHGHAPGDLIEVEEKQFVVDYYKTINPYYNITIAREGVLKNNTYVILHHVGNDILKIEIKE